MKRRYPRPALSADLFPELVDVLLGGWGAPRTPENQDPFRIFSLTDADLAHAWQQHRDALMAEWVRRGGQGVPWAAQEFDGITGDAA